MKNLSTGTGIGADPDFLNGNIVDLQTLLDTTILQDIVQFFQKLKSKAGLTENGLFDNEVNGYQTVEALDKRNHVAKAKIFEINFYQAAPVNVGFPLLIYYPYAITLNYAKVVGLYSANIGGSIAVGSIDATSNATNLATGLTLSSGNWEIKAYTDRIEVTNISTSVAALALSVRIFGQKA